MQEPVLWGVAYTLLSGCFFDPTGESAEGAGGDDDDQGSETSTSPTDPTTATPTSSPPSSSDPSDGPGSATETTDGPDDTSATTPTTGPDDTGDPPSDVCPAALPNGWILCEDFEDIPDPDMYFPVWDTNVDGLGDSMRIDTMQSHTGVASLATRHDPAAAWAGSAWIRFGAGPVETPHMPEATFEEVWVRLHFLLEEGWDIGGLGSLVEVNSMVAPWRYTMSASVEALPGSPTLRGRARTCILDDLIACDGMMDPATMQELANDPGETALFDGSGAGDWHCLVMHVRLNTPGQSDGILDISLDGGPEAELAGLDYRSNFTDAGLNAIQLLAFLDGGAPHSVTRYIDDIVVSEMSLDCVD